MLEDCLVLVHVMYFWLQLYTNRTFLISHIASLSFQNHEQDIAGLKHTPHILLRASHIHLSVFFSLF